LCRTLSANRLRAIRVGTALPVRDVARLTGLLCDKIQTIDSGVGIEIMSLTATLADTTDRSRFLTVLYIVSDSVRTLRRGPT
jgi:protein ImuB